MKVETEAPTGARPQRPLAGKVAIVTGAAKGIGGVVTENLARDGAHVALVGRDTGALEDHARLVDGKYPERRSMVLTCDVTEQDQVDAMVASAVERFGGETWAITAAPEAPLARACDHVVVAAPGETGNRGKDRRLRVAWQPARRRPLGRLGV